MCHKIKLHANYKGNTCTPNSNNNKKLYKYRIVTTYIFYGKLSYVLNTKGMCHF